MHALAFNGQWRIGSDSAKYRSVARSLAAGDGYAILGEPQRLVYPGLPFLLAGLEKLFGEAVWPGVIVVLVMSAAALWFIYDLVRRVVPEWAATVVVVGVAFNAMFAGLSHELLTDVPFLLGVMMVLWGWETMTDAGLAARLRGGSCLVLGLGLSAAMRPTFWIIALALVLVCIGGLAASLMPRAQAGAQRGWRFYAGCLAAVALVGALFVAIDPRKTQSLLGGNYEFEMVERVLRPMDRLREAPAKLWFMLEDHMVAAFFAERVEGLNLLGAACLLVGVVLVGRRRPLWAVIFLVFLGTIFFASSSARYYLMVLPTLWLGWVMLACAIAGGIFRDHPWRRSWYVAISCGIVLICNAGHDGKLILEQRSRPFLQHYEHGEYAPVAAMATLIEQTTGPHDRIISPYAAEMTYLSRRHALGHRQLFTARQVTPRVRAAVLRDSGAQWAVFPTTVYLHKDLPLYQLGQLGIFVPSNRDDSTIHSAGTFDGVKWYLTRDWAVDQTMVPAAARR